MMKVLKWGIALLGASAALLALGFLAFVYSIDRELPSTVAKADGIVVLTGGTERIAQGVKLLADRRAGRLLISGVNKKTSKKALLRHAPGQSALFRCCVDVGYEARDTLGNARETRQWVIDNKFSSLIVVTSSYHMPRSLVELRRAIPGVSLHPHPVVPSTIQAGSWWSHPGMARLLLWEYVKFLPAATRFYVVWALGTETGIPTATADAVQPT